jgi:NADH-quinone oxidoreductase subunit M
VIGWLCLGNLVYCGWVAMKQKDLSRMLGYSSVAHMGFVFLGIASLSLIGITGAVLVMIAHGFLAALSFGLSGYLYHQTGTLEMDQLGGLLRRLPFIGTALMMAALAGCGLPGFANFAGEMTVFFGAWGPLPRIVVFATWGGLIIGALYMLRAMRAILHGPLPAKWDGVADAPNLWRKVPFALLLACLMVFGCFPRLLTDKISESAKAVLPTTSASAKAIHAAAAQVAVVGPKAGIVTINLADTP